MKYGTDAADEAGYPMIHVQRIQQVANQMDHVIMFRSVGRACKMLLEEGYATKGFRIDTKSSDWGPMSGFVCADPRLSKGGSGADVVKANSHATREAVSGSVRVDAVGDLPEDSTQVEALMKEWTGGAKPLVISARRFEWLTTNGGLGSPADDRGHKFGISEHKGQKLPWRLIPARVCANVPGYTAACGPLPEGGYGIFVDRGKLPFRQMLPGLASEVGLKVSGYEPLLGLINPGTSRYGYRACVTGDYDLFGVWPPKTTADLRVNRLQNPDARFVDKFKGKEKQHHHQHYLLGNITPRINLIKVLLNTALQHGDSGKYTGGQMVHHSDEIGNPSPGLVKQLHECFPILAFTPGSRMVQLLQNEQDFIRFTRSCQDAYVPALREEWKKMVM